MLSKPVIFLAFANDKVDSTRYLRNIPMEHNEIRKALQEADKQGLCEVVERANASIEQVLDVFQDLRYRDRIAIFHFGGHADGYQLLLESSLHPSEVKDLEGVNQTAHGVGIVAFLAQQKGLRLVFFNGCTTKQQAKELSEAGIPVVIGTVSEISDEVATHLASRFYKGIGEEMDIERAWNEAVNEITMRNGSGNMRGLYRKDLKEPLPNKIPWEMYYKDKSLLTWKLKKVESTMNPEKKNESNVTGNKNLVIQGLENSHINVNITNNNPQIVNNQIDNSIDKNAIMDLIEQGDIAKVFEELDKKGIKDFQYNRFKKEFSAGLKGVELSDFIDRVKVYMSLVKF
ncbi:CHAT domain-containing protein [Thermoflexibacter ruber]|uniref:CHAT domain-containing protein n=1 Tax=Thermoflexibacter ruber TaxID=1003 RepID=A0A1I2DI40_9BACT|nr:CHAT domain-containing protein [Thermoflexibacter ruber]SFE79903.1 CHAT domain-containing protein [Thermoflexibacter ruber]